MADVGSAQIRVELAQDYLKSQIAGLQTDLKGIKDVQVTASDGGSFAKLIAGVNQFQQSVAEASQYVQGLSATAAQLGQLAEGMKQASGAAFEAASGLDAAQRKVETLGANAEAFTQSNRELSAALKYQTNTTDALDASYDVLSSGFQTVTEVQDVMRASTYAAVGGFTDVGTASDALTSVMNAYGKETYKASQVADILIATQNAGKITVAQYGRLIGRVASTAAQAGVSLEELSGFVANATVKGVRASSTIDGLRQAIAAVLKPTKLAADEAARLGIKFDEGALKTGGLKGILDQLNAVGANSNSTLIKLFGSVEAVAAIVPSAGSNMASLNTQIGYITDSAGMAELGFDKVASSIQGQLTAAANQGKEALTSLGAGAAAVILPLAGAAVSLISAFNGLPEPVKAGAGALLTVATGAVTAGAAVTGLLAVIPVVTAGWAALGTIFGSTTATQVAATAATVAQAVATETAAAALPALAAGEAETALAATALAASETAATTATTALATAETAAVGATEALAAEAAVAATATTSLAGGATVAAGATTGFTASVGALLGTLGALLIPLAAAAAAALALKNAWDVASAMLGKGEAATGVNEALKAIDALEPATFKTAEGMELLGGSMQDIGQLMQENGGLIGAFTARLGQLADKLNLPFDIYTAKQVDAQKATIAFESVVASVGSRLDTGRQLLEKYGQGAAEAGKRHELSKGQIEAFTAKSKEQVEAIDGTISALKKIKPIDDSNAASIQAQIALLSHQKEVLVDRTKALGVDTGALAENADATQFLTDKIAGLVNAYKESVDASQLAAEATKANLLDQAVAAGKSADDVQQAIAGAERDGLQERIKIAQSKTEELKKLLTTTQDPAKVKEVQAEIAKIEADGYRDRQAVANSVLQERQEAEDKAKQAIEDKAREAEKAAQEGEQAQKDTEQKAKQALQEQVSAADAAYQQQTGKLKNALDEQLAAIQDQQEQGKLTVTQANNAKFQAVSDSLKAELALIDKQTKEVANLKASGAITEQEAQSRLTDLEGKAIQTRNQLKQSEVEAHKQALAEMVKASDSAYQLQSAKLKNALDSQLVAIKEQQAAGKLTKEQAEKAKVQATIDGLKAELAEVAKTEAAAKDLRAKGAISQEELQQRLIDLESKSLATRGQLADQQITQQEAKAKEAADAQAKAGRDGHGQEADSAKDLLTEQKRLRDEQVKAAQDAYDRAAKAAQVGVAEEIAKVKQAQAGGGITGDEAAKKEQEIRDNANKAELAAIAKQIAAINKLKRSGALSAEEAEQKILDLRNQRAQVQTALAESQIQANQKAQEQAAQAKDKIEQNSANNSEDSANREQEARAKAEEAKRKAIEETRKAQELAAAKAKTFESEAVLQALQTSKAKGESREQLEVRLAKLDQEALDRAKASAQAELSSLADQVQKGVITEADADKRKEELKQQLAQIGIQAIQAQDKADELAHKAQIARIDERLKLSQTEAQQAQAARQLVINQLGLEKANLSSLADLSKARNDLDAQRLQYSLEDAKTDQEKLAAQQAINAQKLSALAQEQAYAKQNLELEIQQRDLELQKQAIAAQQAVVESQLAIEKAKSSGASQKELDLLNTQLGLRQLELGQIAKQAQFNDQVLATRERETLLARQQKETEDTQRQAAQSVIPLLGDQAANLKPSELSQAQIFGRNPVSLPNPLSNPDLVSQGLPGDASQSMTGASQNLAQAMDKLAQAFSQNKTPSQVTVVTNDPAADFSQVLRQLAK